jgi:hypothetical protein
MIHVNKEAVLSAFESSGDIEVVVKAFEVPAGVPRAMIEEICGTSKSAPAPAPVVKKEPAPAPVVKKEPAPAPKPVETPAEQ